jgi:chromosomal replication initiation ATPase DnaA
MTQLPLDLGHRASYGGDDFLVAPCNEAAVAWLDRWPDWPGPGLALWGPAGCGKTHLAHVFQARSGARQIQPAALSQDSLAILAGGNGELALDGAPPIDERALLHLHNLLAERQGHLLILSREAPARWDVRLADLASRLAAMPAIRIDPPDEVLIEGLLVKLFADRQLAVQPEVVTYLLRRMERSFEAARQLVARLDRESLARRRPVTLPLAREVFESDLAR